METIDRIIERYFEANLSEAEEARLKAFLTSDAGQAPEYDEVRAVMGFFATGRSVVRQAHQPYSRSLSLSKGPWFDKLTRRRWWIAAAASLLILLTLGVNQYNKNNVCVSIVEGRKVTDKEVVMNDVDNILSDLLADRMDMEEQLIDIFGE